MFYQRGRSCFYELSSQGLSAVFERFRDILYMADINKRIQYTIEDLFAIRRVGFEKSGYPSRLPDLDILDEESNITHKISLNDEIEPETGLDIFKFDIKFIENERMYEKSKNEMLGTECEIPQKKSGDEDKLNQVHDKSSNDILNLRRAIYLTIVSSLDFEEAGHKLLKLSIAPDKETELVTMVMECCSQERTYHKYFGLIAQRFCLLKKSYKDMFEECFVKQFNLVHRLETNKLRNLAKFFAHLLGTNAISWEVLKCIHLTIKDTTSSSRIFIKILFQELTEILSLKILNARIHHSKHTQWYDHIFLRDNVSNIRFSINFFTSIGLGGLTDEMREYLKQLPELIGTRHMENLSHLHSRQTGSVRY